MNDTPWHILFYEYVENMAERRVPHREGHLAHIRAAREAGKLELAGALGEPAHGGALVFRGCEPSEIEAFVGEDPYMHAGLITSWRVEPWKLV
jgi:uncharacterized protein YciI